MSADEGLTWSVKNGDLDALKKMIETEKVDVNKELIGGRNALHFAADYGQISTIEYLVEKGADINIPDKHGITPLLAAIWENHKDVVEYLLKKGAKKDLKAPDGKSYFESAETDDIKQLLK